jgi:hypothetical protein
MLGHASAAMTLDTDADLFDDDLDAVSARLEDVRATNLWGILRRAATKTPGSKRISGVEGSGGWGIRTRRGPLEYCLDQAKSPKTCGSWTASDDSGARGFSAVVEFLWGLSGLKGRQ